MAITDKETGVWGLDQVYNKINQGAGISRSSKSGFMEGDIFAGTNSGFSS